jgi:Ice-binding-like
MTKLHLVLACLIAAVFAATPSPFVLIEPDGQIQVEFLTAPNGFPLLSTPYNTTAITLYEIDQMLYIGAEGHLPVNENVIIFNTINYTCNIGRACGPGILNPVGNTFETVSVFPGIRTPTNTSMILKEFYNDPNSISDMTYISILGISASVINNGTGVTLMLKNQALHAETAICGFTTSAKDARTMAIFNSFIGEFVNTAAVSCTGTQPLLQYNWTLISASQPGVAVQYNMSSPVFSNATNSASMLYFPFANPSATFSLEIQASVYDTTDDAFQILPFNLTYDAEADDLLSLSQIHLNEGLLITNNPLVYANTYNSSINSLMVTTDLSKFTVGLINVNEAQTEISIVRQGSPYNAACMSILGSLNYGNIQNQNNWKAFSDNSSVTFAVTASAIGGFLNTASLGTILNCPLDFDIRSSQNGLTAAAGPGPVETKLGPIASAYAVLAYSAITGSTGAGSVITGGNIGCFLGSTFITNFPPSVVTSPGVIDNTDVVAARTAGSEALTYYLGLPAGTTESALSGTLTPGTYTSASTMTLATSTTLTLNGAGMYIFQIGSSLTIGTGASIVLTGGATADNVVWACAVSATVNSGTVMVGNIIVGTSITLGGGNFSGRALAVGTGDGAVTFSTTVNMTVPGTAPSLSQLTDILPLFLITERLTFSVIKNASIALPTNVSTTPLFFSNTFSASSPVVRGWVSFIAGAGGVDVCPSFCIANVTSFANSNFNTAPLSFTPATTIAPLCGAPFAGCPVYSFIQTANITVTCNICNNNTIPYEIEGPCFNNTGGVCVPSWGLFFSGNLLNVLNSTLACSQYDYQQTFSVLITVTATLNNTVNSTLSYPLLFSSTDLLANYVNCPAVLVGGQAGDYPGPAPPNPVSWIPMRLTDTRSDQVLSDGIPDVDLLANATDAEIIADLEKEDIGGTVLPFGVFANISAQITSNQGIGSLISSDVARFEYDIIFGFVAMIIIILVGVFIMFPMTAAPLTQTFTVAEQEDLASVGASTSTNYDTSDDEDYGEEMTVRQPLVGNGEKRKSRMRKEDY